MQTLLLSGPGLLLDRAHRKTGFQFHGLQFLSTIIDFVAFDLPKTTVVSIFILSSLYFDLNWGSILFFLFSFFFFYFCRRTKRLAHAKPKLSTPEVKGNPSLVNSDQVNVELLYIRGATPAEMPTQKSIFTEKAKQCLRKVRQPNIRFSVRHKLLINHFDGRIVGLTPGTRLDTLGNSELAAESHSDPRSGGTHTCVEYSIIMMGPLRGKYKKQKRIKVKGLEQKLEERKYERRQRNSIWGR